GASWTSVPPTTRSARSGTSARKSSACGRSWRRTAWTPTTETDLHHAARERPDLRRALTRLGVGRTNGRRKGRNVIKMLKRAIGTRRKGFGLIGRVDQSGSGKSIIEVGTPNDDGSWTKIPNGG